MKTRYIFALLLLSSFAISGCEAMLEVDGPIDQQTADKVFQDDASAEGAVVGMYSSLMKFSPGPFTGMYTVTLGLAADELYRTNVNQAYDQFYENEVSPDNFLISDLWRGNYAAIYHINAVLAKLAGSTVLTQERRDRWMGEAYFNRALCYFLMVNYYGGVPLLVSPDYRQSATAPRTGVDSIYTQIFEDLEEAYQRLSPDYFAQERVRANKWAAAALLARAHLYRGNWSEAEKFAREVIQQEGYELVGVDEVGKNSNEEAILQLTMSNTFSENNYDGVMLLFTSWDNNRPEYAVTDALLNAFEPGDTRRAAWFKDQQDSQGNMFRMAYKYKIQWGTSNARKQEHLTVLRLAEQHLILAEALAQQDRLDEAVDELDKVRERADVPLWQETTGTFNRAQVLDWILEERQRELCFEMGHRWFDLVRTGEADVHLGSMPDKNWQPTDTLFPIPQSERLLNPTLKQNPGYQ